MLIFADANYKICGNMRGGSHAWHIGRSDWQQGKPWIPSHNCLLANEFRNLLMDGFNATESHLKDTT